MQPPSESKQGCGVITGDGCDSWAQRESPSLPQLGSRTPSVTPGRDICTTALLLGELPALEFGPPIHAKQEGPGQALHGPPSIFLGWGGGPPSPLETLQSQSIDDHYFKLKVPFFFSV